MRLIDADMLDFTIPENPHPLTAALVQIVKDDLDRCTIVDAVPVVRCGECKHYKATNSKNGRKVCYKHLLTPHPMLPDEFCSRGERKDGEG